MLKKIKTYKELPFEEGKTYTTRFATAETFLLKEIVWKEFKEGNIMIKKMILFRGIYQKCPDLGLCPLNIDRLIPDRIEDGEMEVCEKCGEPINKQ